MKKIKMFLLCCLFVVVSSCGEGGTTTGNPVTVKMEFASFNNSIAKRISNLFISKAHAGLTSLKLCLKRVRFKIEDSSTGSDIELELGEVEIKEEGTPLGNIQISEGVYKRIEFDISKDCDGTTKNAVTIANDNGNFTSDDGVTIRFEGAFSPGSGDLTLFVQVIVDKIKDYQLSDGDIKDQLESVSGTY
jgi:hypothetical protein